jgi:hypothetical protein
VLRVAVPLRAVFRLRRAGFLGRIFMPDLFRYPTFIHANAPMPRDAPAFAWIRKPDDIDFFET